MADSYRFQSVESHPQELSRASADLLTAAEREAAEIVAAARADVHRTVLKAHHDLLALSAQVETTIELLEGRDRDTHPPRISGRQAASNLLSEAHAGLDALSSEPRVIDTFVPDVWASIPAAPALSRFEMENSRIPPAPPRPSAARRARLAPAAIARAASIVVIGGLVVALAGAWAWGKRPGGETARPRVGATNAAGGNDAAAEPTGMIGHDDSPGKTRGSRPANPQPVERRAGIPSRPTAPDAANRSASAPAGTSTGASAAVRQELIAGAERWLAAYYVHDAGRMGALSTSSVTVTDERTTDERLPAGLTGVRRTLGDANVQVFGADAILTAKVIERAEGDGRESAGFISQMWTRRGGVWQVTDVRIVSAAAVARAFRR